MEKTKRKISVQSIIIAVLAVLLIASISFTAAALTNQATGSDDATIGSVSLGGNTTITNAIDLTEGSPSAGILTKDMGNIEYNGSVAAWYRLTYTFSGTNITGLDAIVDVGTVTTATSNAFVVYGDATVAANGTIELTDVAFNLNNVTDTNFVDVDLTVKVDVVQASAGTDAEDAFGKVTI